jgi:predicted negative regulator of RcsB-dependent stress response
MATEKKFARKDLKEPDEFITITDRFFEYCAKNKNLVISVVVIIVLAAGAVFALITHREKQMQQMEALLFEMKQTSLNSDKKPEEIATNFESFLKDFSDGPQKERAQLLLADQYFRSNQADKSANTYKELMSSSKPGEMAYDFAELGLAYSLELAKNTKEAIGVFKAVIAREGGTPLFQAYLALARIYEAEKDTNNALLILREMETKFQKHSEFTVVQEKIASLENLA